uniref:Uncharacterized protein n=1 Tax=Arundo donax TaxID=35708 RepID=A0A0A9G815_ARUDO
MQGAGYILCFVHAASNQQKIAEFNAYAASAYKEVIRHLSNVEVWLAVIFHFRYRTI